jgi:hypothetical protein
MPGRPKLRALQAAIAAHGGLGHYCERIADGETVANICRELGVSRLLWDAAVNRTPGGRERVQRAREIAAGAYAERQVEVAEAATPATANADRLRIDTYRWLASRYNPMVYGDQSKVNASVQISIGSLHLDALKKVKVNTVNTGSLTPHTGSPAPALPPAADALPSDAHAQVVDSTE